jgi:hypothetical protein
MVVKHSMSTVRNTLLQSLCLAALAACATGGAVDDGYEQATGKNNNVAKCPEGLIAICIDTHCTPDEYSCADQDDVRDMFDVQTPAN